MAVMDLAKTTKGASRPAVQKYVTEKYDVPENSGLYVANALKSLITSGKTRSNDV